MQWVAIFHSTFKLLVFVVFYAGFPVENFLILGARMSELKLFSGTYVLHFLDREGRKNKNIGNNISVSVSKVINLHVRVAL